MSSFSHLNQAETLPLTVIQTPRRFLLDSNNEDSYFSEMLTLALNKTASTYGPWQFKDHGIWLADNRLKAAMRRNEVDVVWFSSSPDMETSFIPVKFSLFGELSNYRILIIRKEDQARFSTVENVKDLRKFVGGLSAQWADAAIMKANKLPQISSVDYIRLFKMLAAGRFDYFSRGLYQIKREVELFPELDLAMEQSFMLYYPSSYYFFVSKSKPELAVRILEGLKIAKADGSFDELLFSVSRHRWAADELARGHRKIISLEAPRG